MPKITDHYFSNNLLGLTPREPWQALIPEQRRKFPPIAPDSVIELRAATDDFEMLHSQMQEYMDAAMQLAWLINPQ